MKHFKPIILILLVFSNYWLSAQKKEDKALVLYNKGVKKFEMKKYKEADSLFTLSNKLYPDFVTSYKLAITKLMIGDTCKFCLSILQYHFHIPNFLDFEDQIKKDIYITKCISKKEAYYNNILHPDSTFSAVFIVSKCDNKIINREYSILNNKSNSVSTFNKDENDSTYMNDRNFPGVFPELSSFKAKNQEFNIRKEMPSYPGGDFARIKFLQSKISYPNKAKINGIQGTVYITFIVEADGNISNVKVIKGIGGGCDEEALRIVKSMPNWNPGKIDGVPVRVQFFMPVKFTLN